MNEEKLFDFSSPVDVKSYILTSSYKKRLEKETSGRKYLGLGGILFLCFLILGVLSHESYGLVLYAFGGVISLAFLVGRWIFIYAEYRAFLKNAAFYALVKPLNVEAEIIERHYRRRYCVRISVAFNVTFEKSDGKTLSLKTRDLYKEEEKEQILNAFRTGSLKAFYFEEGEKDSLILLGF